MNVLTESWPSSYDDREIDDIIWSEIESSLSKGDFVCYLIHHLSKARHREEAQLRLEFLPEGSSTIPVGYARAAERIRELAERGDASAMFHMGKLLIYGMGLQQDLRLAEWWYGKAIDQGEIRACCNMGWLYLYGFDGIAANKKKAFELLSAGSDGGIPSARATIGLMLVTGDGCPADPGRGLRLMEEAFEEGYNNAGNHLSDLYFAGMFVPKDIDLAHEWLFRVVARGDERTMGILGYYLVTGSHGRQDVGQGISLLQESIEKGYVPAYLWIGNLYKDGQGVRRDLQKAKAWFEQGAAAGNSGCTLALTTMLLKSKPDYDRDNGPAN